MGADTFINFAEGADVNKAFSEAHRRACWEHGNGGYTGSLAEKGDFVVIDRQARTREQAEAEAYRLINASDARIDDKWGPAGALPYWNGTKSEPQVKTITVKVTDADVANPAASWAVSHHIQEAMAVKCGKNQLMIEARIVGEPQNVKTVVKSASTKGKVVKKYTVGRMEFDSMTAARAFMDKALREAAAQGRPMELQIDCVQVREDGSPLASGTVAVKSAEYTVEVKATKVSADFNREPDGWIFFGWASS